MLRLQPPRPPGHVVKPTPELIAEESGREPNHGRRARADEYRQADAVRLVEDDPETDGDPGKCAAHESNAALAGKQGPFALLHERSPNVLKLSGGTGEAGDVR